MKLIICNLLILLSQFIYGFEMDSKLSLLKKDETFINITNMLNKHKIIVFKNQNITKDKQITISEYWGYINKQPYGNRPLYKNKLLIINNTKNDKYISRNDHWHSDLTPLMNPPSVTILYMHKLKNHFGLGNTLFIDMEKCLENIPYKYHKYLSKKALHSTDGFKKYNKEKVNRYYSVWHPLVRKNYRTNKNSLFISDFYIHHIEGFSVNKSKYIIRKMLDICLRYKYEHKWTEKDVLIYDNLNTIHYANFDYPKKAIRTLYSTRTYL
tara:strand:+ start:988 stop:1791 length:804 start_codon:yes stop_codon:yes gene_type:complete